MAKRRAGELGYAPVRVLVVDDHEMVCEGLFALLSDVDGVSVCGWATSAPQAIEAVERECPDVVLMDVRLGEQSGIEAAREIRSRQPATKVLMLTSFADDEARLASLMAGASGVVTKGLRGIDLVGAIRSVACGHSLIDDAMIRRLIQRLGTIGHPDDEKLARLSAQEARVLDLVAEGRTNKQICEMLFISEKTVKNHLSHILSKLEVSRRAEAAVYLARHGRAARERGGSDDPDTGSAT